MLRLDECYRHRIHCQQQKNQKNSEEQTQHQSEKTVGSVDYAASRLIESAIDIFFDGARESIAVLSKAPAVRAADDSITSYAGTQTAGRGENSAKGRTELAMKELFSLLQGGHPEYTEIYMGTKWGGYASSSDSDIPSGFDPRVRPWYRQAMSAPGQVVLSPAYLSWTGSPVVACAA